MQYNVFRHYWLRKAVLRTKVVLFALFCGNVHDHKVLETWRALYW